MSIKSTQTAVVNEQAIVLFELKNNTGTTVCITNIGSTITSIQTPDKNGKIEEVTLGFNDPLDYLNEAYLKNCPFLGATAGRFANRIAKGKFKLDGKSYTVPVNNDANHLHGGPDGFHQQIWKGRIEGESLVMTLVSPDGHMGYPGKLTARVKYTLTDAHELIMDYLAESDQACPVNLTNHAYFNLRGKKASILDQEVMIMADHYTPAIDAIPTGEIAPVKDTAFDFSSLRTIGEKIDASPIKTYDHNFVLNHPEGQLERAALALDKETGRVLEVFTTLPGMQFYAGKFLDGSYARGDWYFESHEGFCLETQYFPDSPNHPKFPDCIARPGKPFKHTTVFKFATQA